MPALACAYVRRRFFPSRRYGGELGVSPREVRVTDQTPRGRVFSWDDGSFKACVPPRYVCPVASALSSLVSTPSGPMSHHSLLGYRTGTCGHDTASSPLRSSDFPVFRPFTGEMTAVSRGVSVPNPVSLAGQPGFVLSGHASSNPNSLTLLFSAVFGRPGPVLGTSPAIDLFRGRTWSALRSAVSTRRFCGPAGDAQTRSLCC